MIFRKIKAFHNNRAGFTLIELIAARAITGRIGMGASIASAQVLNQTSKNTHYTAPSRNAMNALHWISRDALMAQTIDGTEGFPQTESLCLGWVGWDNSVYSANYTLVDGKLRRVYSNGSAVTTTSIAEHINSDASLTHCVSDNGTIIFTITSSVGEGDRVINVTKVREISSRPDL